MSTPQGLANWFMPYHQRKISSGRRSRSDLPDCGDRIAGHRTQPGVQDAPSLDEGKYRSATRKVRARNVQVGSGCVELDDAPLVLQWPVGDPECVGRRNCPVHDQAKDRSGGGMLNGTRVPLRLRRGDGDHSSGQYKYSREQLLHDRSFSIHSRKRTASPSALYSAAGCAPTLISLDGPLDSTSSDMRRAVSRSNDVDRAASRGYTPP
jgi:hypothetical protein